MFGVLRSAIELHSTLHESFKSFEVAESIARIELDLVDSKWLRICHGREFRMITLLLLGPSRIRIFAIIIPAFLPIRLLTFKSDPIVSAGSTGIR